MLDREVAVKRLHCGRGLRAVRSRMVRKRMHRGSRVAVRLHHPRLATIYDITMLNGEVGLVTEYVAAPAPAELLRAGWPAPAPGPATVRKAS